MASQFIHRHAIWIAIGLSVLLSVLGLNLYVDRLFVTFLHEASHGLAAILTGGRLMSFTVSPDTSGLAWTSGGFRPLIVMAGYIGSCLWGGALLVASRRRGWEKAVLFGLSVFFLAFTVLFVRNLFGFGVGLSLGAFFGWVGWHGKNWHGSMLLCFLAVQSSLCAINDLFGLMRLSSGSNVQTDASIMSRELTMGVVPPLVFAVIISVFAVLTFALFLRLALQGERRGEEPSLPERARV